MRIGIAADHAGFELKNYLATRLRAAGVDFVDFGAAEYDARDDYPDRIGPLAQAVAAGTVARGIAVCGSGVGACIVANKYKGVRASLVLDAYSAAQGVEHDQMNVICLGSRVTGEELAWLLVNQFLQANFNGAERHARRLAKVKQLEANFPAVPPATPAAQSGD
jgi:ribose 5-phosphate isomerase B